MRCALRTVYHDRNTVLMRNTYDFIDIIHRAKHVADMSDAHDTCPVGKQMFKFIDEQLSAIVHRNDTDGNAFPGGLQLPRYDIGMMFHDGQYHLVPFSHKLIAER